MMRAYLGLGANIGNRTENLRMALRLLGAGAGVDGGGGAACRVVAVSSLYRSGAVVSEGTAPGPDYLNAVCEVETDLLPGELLAFAKEIEHLIGRREAARWAARPIDIDILLYGEEVIETAELTVPHPRITERNFVLVPLAELAQEVVHPALGRTIGSLAEDAEYDNLEHVSNPDWASG